MPNEKAAMRKNDEDYITQLQSENYRLKEKVKELKTLSTERQTDATKRQTDATKRQTDATNSYHELRYELVETQTKHSALLKNVMFIMNKLELKLGGDDNAE